MAKNNINYCLFRTSGENGLCDAEDDEDHDEEDLGEDVLSPNLDRLLGGDPNATNGYHVVSFKSFLDEEGDYAADSDDASMWFVYYFYLPILFKIKS